MPPGLDPKAVRLATDEILAAPPFSSSRDGAALVLRQWLNRLSEWFEFDLGSLYLDRPLLFWAMMLGGLVLAALLAWHVSWSLRGLWRIILGQPATPPRQPDPTPLSLEPARRALAQGELRRSIELGWEVVKGRLPEAGGERQTPRTLAQRLAAGLDAPGQLALWRLVAAHERACYSGQAPDLELATVALDAARRIHEAR